MFADCERFIDVDPHLLREVHGTAGLSIAFPRRAILGFDVGGPFAGIEPGLVSEIDGAEIRVAG
ncbi:MAG TPA: hypothetical protein VGD81_10645, partial [Opitutaceae bacterium]